MPTAKIYPPVGRCIYCGTVARNLGKEHIIPFGLGGDMVLPRASCHECAASITKVERRCLHNFFGPGRIRLGIQTRHPEARPKELELKYIKPDLTVHHVRKIPSSKHPIIAWGLKLPTAGILTNSPISNEIKGELWMHYSRDEVREYFPATPDEGNLLLVEFDAATLFRMIAKIAHSYAIAELGPGGFDPFLVELILKGVPCASHWIGTAQPPESGKGGLHALDAFYRVVNGTDYVIAYVWLFCAYGEAPLYEVVVGERIRK